MEIPFWSNVDSAMKNKHIENVHATQATYSSTHEISENQNIVVSRDAKKSKEPSLSNSGPKVDVVIVTAVDTEYNAVKRVFNEVFSQEFANGFIYSLASYKITSEKNITIAIFRQNSMGLVSSAMTATYALNKFNPEMLLMCGVCASVKGKAELGDLIVFSPVFDYGSGKYLDGQFLADYQQRKLNATVRPIVEEMVSNTGLARLIKDEWTIDTGKPNTELQIHIFPGGSGAAVITDEKIVEEIKKHQRTLGAIDMEAYAIAEVANTALRKEIPWLVVKGVQDFASPLKNDQYREYSAQCSGVFLREFLRLYYSKYPKE